MTTQRDLYFYEAGLAEGRRDPDPLRPPETDEEPWSPCDAPAPTAARWWLVALAAVLLLLGLRAVRRP